VENRFVRKIEKAFSARASGKREGDSDPLKALSCNLDVGHRHPNRGEHRVCRVFETQPLLLRTFFRSSTRVPLRQRRHHGRPLQRYSEELRDELTRLLRKQTEVLEF
jgi:hypothetical protein